jgi:uncharacterized protein (DUF305 family)
MKEQAHGGQYGRLLAMTALSFVVMYALMYAMVNSFANVLNNVNQVYMAAMMAAAMVLIELVAMRSMYPDKRKNAIVVLVGLIALAGAWLAIRNQTLVGDRQFLRSMIPHHAGAILMCGQANIQDPEVKELCRSITASQTREIDQMKAILRRMDEGK